MLAVTTTASFMSPARATSPASCQTPAPAAEAIAPWSSLTAGTPEGSQLALLAAGEAQKMPGTVGTVQLSRLQIPADYKTDSLRATGPILFYVESGSILVFINGEEHQVAAGNSALVDEFKEYAVEQAGNEPAVVLRLGVMPENSSVQEIAIFQPLADTEDATRPAVAMEVEYLVLGQSIDLPQAPATLLVGCLNVSAAAGQENDVVHRGVVGFYVQEGAMRVYAIGELPTSGCTIVAPGAAHMLNTSGDATALLFAVLPAGVPIWAEGITPREDDEWRARYQLDCGNYGRSA
ncbi:MAG: hypothetical protein QM692_21295 [Thermomicrobiales bacterium]